MFHATGILDFEGHPHPRTTALLATGDNFMPASWHMPVSKLPFRYAVAVREENHTHKLLHENKEFSLNFLDFSFAEAYQIAGEHHGGDKFLKTRLHPKKAQEIQSTLIEEAYMIYECKVIDVLNFGDHDLFIADVVCTHNAQTAKNSPTLFLGKGYYDTLKQNYSRQVRIV